MEENRSALKILTFKSSRNIPLERLRRILKKWISSWPRGNVLHSRSKVRGFKPGRGRWIFSGRKNPEHKSSGRDFKLEVPNLRFLAR